MPRYAAFLRGMNLGGRRITNDELVAAVESLGFRDVGAFLASGNVTFTADSDDAEAVARRFEEGLEESLGYPVPTCVRTADEVRAAAESEAIPRDVEDASEGKLQVAFLKAAPSAADRKTALELSTDDDLLAFGEGFRELYWLPKGPMSQSEVDWKAVEKAVGTTTVRTANTVRRLAGKLG
jgi:uncharacterized protein (DUF1697 family)